MNYAEQRKVADAAKAAGARAEREATIAWARAQLVDTPIGIAPDESITRTAWNSAMRSLIERMEGAPCSPS